MIATENTESTENDGPIPLWTLCSLWFNRERTHSTIGIKEALNLINDSFPSQCYRVATAGRVNLVATFAAALGP